ncbi:MAG: hypothetical protein ACC726_13195 [Chloroflexota bacterium]
MNDYQMTSLASDHSSQLMAEAEQHRLARRSKRSSTGPKSVVVRSGLRISLGFLIGRSPA